jgi:Tfp pilus assembly protein PilF
MTNRFIFFVFVLLLLLSGCAGVNVPGFSEVEESGGAEVTAYEAPSQMTAVPLYSAAVRELLYQAQQQRQAGQLPEAAVTLERALGIEPRNPHVWNRLAHLRMEQGMTAQAIDLATKSKTLAGSDLELQRDNWRLIAAGRRAVGDIEGARSAEEKLRLLQ